MIKKDSIRESIFSKTEIFRRKSKKWIRFLSNYPTKANLKTAAGVDTSDFAKKNDLANSKSDINKLAIDKFKNVPSGLSSLKSKVHKLDIGQLETAAVDLSKLSDVVKNEVVKKDWKN